MCGRRAPSKRVKVVGRGRPILEEVVAFSSECLSKHQKDAAAKGTGVGRGGRKQCRPFTDSLVDAECSWVGEDTCNVYGKRAGKWCKDPDESVGGLPKLVGGAKASMVPVPPYRKEEVRLRRSRTEDLSKGGQSKIGSVRVDTRVDVKDLGEWPPGGVVGRATGLLAATSAMQCVPCVGYRTTSAT